MVRLWLYCTTGFPKTGSDSLGALLIIVVVLKISSKSPPRSKQRWKALSQTASNGHEHVIADFESRHFLASCPQGSSPGAKLKQQARDLAIPDVSIRGGQGRMTLSEVSSATLQARD
jgi:hypothetical protein